ncbi:hypothetical protein Ahy_A02g010094 [Arachis hypogaea]|uniref:Uncharacterized protein n=1 Tax=Arachis hypogaea TaxID=3818 RepID=A0A445EJC8_ARAHY|nr:hypothetical protein Ahy_A02g010094 [Arachis hypogaea]
MQQTHRTRMQISAQTTKIVTTQTMLVPPMIHGSNISSENKKKRWQRTKLVDPRPLLHLHPLLDLPRVIPMAPPIQIDHHDPCVEVARLSVRECKRQRRIRPECLCEVRCEIRVAVLRRCKNRRLA